MANNERTKYMTGANGQRYRIIKKENPEKQETKTIQSAFPQMDKERFTQYLEETAPHVSLTTIGSLIESVITAVKKAREDNEYSGKVLLREGDFKIFEDDLDDIQKIYFGLQAHGAFALAILIQLSQHFQFVTKKESKIKQKTLPNFLTQPASHPSTYFAIASEKEQSTWQEIITSYIQTIAQLFPGDKLGQLRALLEVWKAHHQFNVHIKGTKASTKSAIPSFDPDQLRKKLWHGELKTVSAEIENLLPTLLQITQEYSLDVSSEQMLIEPTVRLELQDEDNRLLVTIRLDAVIHQHVTTSLELKSLKSNYEYAIENNELDLYLLTPEHKLELLLQSIATAVIRKRYFTASPKAFAKIKNSKNNAIHHKMNTTVSESQNSNWDQIFQSLQAVELHLIVINGTARENTPLIFPIVFNDRMLFDQTMLYLSSIIEQLNDFETRVLLEATFKRYIEISPSFEIAQPHPTQRPLL
jgi:hypothetical protein